MTLRQRYKTLDRTPSHRIPRCPRCHLIMPCRNDGRYGACGVSDVSHDSILSLCELLRAIFAIPEHESLEDVVGSDTKRDGQLAAARAASNIARPAHCKNDHEQTASNVYEGLRNGKYRVWCAVCQKEQYARKQNGKNKNTRTGPGVPDGPGSAVPTGDCVTG